MPKYAPGFPANKLECIGVLFLRHQARAGRNGVAQMNKSKFRRAIENEIFGHSGKMDHHQGARTHKLNREVAIRNRVEAVARYTLETQLPGHGFAVDRKARSGESARSKRQDVHSLAYVAKPLTVARQHFKISETPMCPHDRLCPLEMCVAGQHRLIVTARGIDQTPLESDDRLVD